MAVAFITWLWGDKYTSSHVNKLHAGVRRHYRGDYCFVVFADRALDVGEGIEVRRIANPELIGRGCFCRLRMFDPQWQAWQEFTDRIVCLDLDVVLTGDLNSVFDREESFLILQKVNSANPNQFNCSVMMLRAGHHPEVWRDFTIEKAEAVNKKLGFGFPDDQGWLWEKLPQAAGWIGGKDSGVYGFQKPGWPSGENGQTLPQDARIVAFFGWRKPEQFASLPWVKEHWRQ
jgi:hypothetical protein